MIKIQRLKLLNYKIHKDSTFTFDDFTEIRKPNEFGKSTIIEAISDAFSLSPDRIKEKRTKGVNENPVISLDITVGKKGYRLSINAQSNTVTLKGSGVHLDSKESVLRFFRKHGYPFFSYIVSNLLVLRERDLDIDTRSREFRKFTEGIFNVENINALKSVLDKILKEKGGFRETSFGKEYAELVKEYAELRQYIANLAEKYRERLEKSRELEDLTKKLESVERSLEDIRRKIEFLEILGNEIKRKELKEQIDNLTKKRGTLKKRIEEIEKDIKRYRKIERDMEGKLDEKRQNLERTRSAEKRLKEIGVIINEIKKKQEEIRDNRLRAESLDREISKREKKINDFEEKIKYLNEKRSEVVKELSRLKDEYADATDRLLVEVEERYKEVQQGLDEARSIEEKLGDIKEKVRPYSKYTLKDLKDAEIKWRTYNRLKESAKGILEVKRGSGRFNGMVLDEGKRMEFEGKLDIEHDGFYATVYTTFELADLEQSLLPYLRSFDNLMDLQEIIALYEKIEEYEKKLRVMDAEKLLEERKKLEKKIKEIKLEIERNKRQKESISRLEHEIQMLESEIKMESETLLKEKTFLELNRKEKEKLLKWLDEVDEDTLKSRLSSYEKEVNDIQTLLKGKEPLEKEVVSLQKDLQDVRRVIAELLKEEGEKRAELGNLVEKVDELTKEAQKLEKYEELVDELPFGFVKNYVMKSYEEIQEEKKNLKEEMDKKIQDKINISQKVSLLRGYLENVSFTDNIDEKRARLLELERKIETFNRMEEFLREVKYVLWTLGERIEKQYVIEIEKRAQEIFSRITGDNYKWVEFSMGSIFTDNFGKNWQAKRHDGVSFDFEDLSDGTKTQLLFSIRLALISLFLGEKKAFLLLDEPFAYYDEERKKVGMEVLKKLSRDGWQIILMSAKA